MLRGTERERERERIDDEVSGFQNYYTSVTHRFYEQALLSNFSDSFMEKQPRSTLWPSIWGPLKIDTVCNGLERVLELEVRLRLDL